MVCENGHLKIFHNMYNIIGTSKYWVGISVFLVTASIIAWLLWGLNLSIDFTGGSSLQLHFLEARPDITAVNTVLREQNIGGAGIQEAGGQDVVLRLPFINNEQKDIVIQNLASFGAEEVNFSTIGPALGVELKKKAVQAVFLVLVGIILYISYAFRKIARAPVPAWAFGLGAIVALIHDITIVVGIFVVLGKFFNIQIDSFFVTALLTILGFSVHDTIVVYDRIREGLKHQEKKSFTEIMNSSINTTLIRSLNTSLTTLIVLSALYLLGGEGIRLFVLALLIGIVVGTYSSIFIASPFLLLIQRFRR